MEKRGKIRGHSRKKIYECHITRGIDVGEGTLGLTCEWCEVPPKTVTMRSEEKRNRGNEEDRLLCPLRLSFPGD